MFRTTNHTVKPLPVAGPALSLFPTITAIFLDTIIAPLVPWFLTAAGGDMNAARHTVISMLASYNVATEEELRLAAEIVSFSFGTMAALAKSMDPDLPLNAVLRLRGSANALHRSQHQCQRVLDRLRKERRLAAGAPKRQPRAPDQVATTQAPGPAAQPAPTQPHPAAFTLSRQQRRAQERAVEKAHRKQAEQSRRDAMRAMRAGSTPAAAPAMIPTRGNNHHPSAAAA
jgi:hypothetical protein